MSMLSLYFSVNNTRLNLGITNQPLHLTRAERVSFIFGRIQLFTGRITCAKGS